MRIPVHLLFYLAAIVSPTFALLSVSNVEKATSFSQDVVPNRFIVEVDHITDIPNKREPHSRSVILYMHSSSRDADRNLQKPHNNFYEALRKRDVEFTVDREFNAEGLFVGAAITLTVSPIRSDCHA